MAFVSDRPFNDLPRLPPAKEIETKPILRACIEARAALAELKISGSLIPCVDAPVRARSFLSG
jgi:hypothetical protein